MAYQVVTFEDGVSVILSEWVTAEDKTQCRWPQHIKSENQMSKLLRDKILPTSSWKTYKILEFLGSYDNLETANRKAVEARIFSDIQSEADDAMEPKRRKRKNAAKRNVISSESERDSSEENCAQYSSKTKEKGSVPVLPLVPSEVLESSLKRNQNKNRSSRKSLSPAPSPNKPAFIRSSSETGRMPLSFGHCSTTTGMDLTPRNETQDSVSKVFESSLKRSHKNRSSRKSLSPTPSPNKPTFTRSSSETHKMPFFLGRWSTTAGMDRTHRNDTQHSVSGHVLASSKKDHGHQPSLTSVTEDRSESIVRGDSGHHSRSRDRANHCHSSSRSAEKEHPLRHHTSRNRTHHSPSVSTRNDYTRRSPPVPAVINRTHHLPSESTRNDHRYRSRSRSATADQRHRSRSRSVSAQFSRHGSTVQADKRQRSPSRNALTPCLSRGAHRQRSRSRSLSVTPVTGHGSGAQSVLDRPSLTSQRISTRARTPPEVYDEVLFRRKMIRWALDIKLAVDSLVQTKGSDVILEDDTTDITTILPLHSKHDLDNFEQKLKNEGFKKRVIVYLARFGGKTAFDAVTTVCHKCISDSLAVEYSYYGKGRSRAAFNSTSLHGVIFSSLRANKKFSSATEEDLKLAVSKFLNRAKERLTAKQLTAEKRQKQAEENGND